MPCKMRILVTGGAGYIGSHAVRRLLDDGHDVTVIDDLSHGHFEAVDDRACFYRVNIDDVDAVTRIFRGHAIQAVMHFAAFIEVGESVTYPTKYYVNNVVNTLKLLDVMRIVGVRKLVFSSTAAVYGNPQYTPIDENHPIQPVNPYGRAKAMVEQILADYATAYALNYVSLRYFNVAGASQDGTLGEAHEPESHLIPRVLQAALVDSARVDIYGTDYPTPDGTCIRDYIHVEDLVSAHVLALEWLQGNLGSRVYNLGSEHGFSVKEVVDACRQVSGRKITAMAKPRRAGDADSLVASSAKIREELGWTLKHPELTTIIEDAWRWHRSHPEGYESDHRKQRGGLHTAALADVMMSAASQG